MDLCIIADDLSGALDSAAPFAGRGLATAVALGPAALGEAMARGPRILAVSTRSREIPADEAAARVAEVTAQLPAGTRILKKIDSRLKGNIAAEIAALDPSSILAAPAIPDFGRVQQGGAVSGFGVELPLPIRPVLGAAGAAVTIPDVLSDADMDAALAAADPAALLVGARGLAEALARRMTGGAALRTDFDLPAPALLVIGSRDPITTAQVEALRAAGANWTAAPNGIASPGAASAGALRLIQLTPGHAPLPPETAAANLAASVIALGAGASRTLFLTGGATAEAVLSTLGLTVLDLQGEVLPGVPLSVAGGHTVIVKSGGFGQPDTLSRLAAMVQAGTEV